MGRWRTLVLLLVVVGVAAGGFWAWQAHRAGYSSLGALTATADAPSGKVETKPAALSPTPIASQSAPSTVMFFTELKLETAGAAPQACLVFSMPLSLSPSVHYEDFIRIDPAAKVSLQANGNRLCIGGLAFEKRYSVTIAQGLPSETGAVSTAPETVAVSFGEMPPHVGFADSGFILSRDQLRGLPIQTVNVDKVKVTVARVGDRILARTQLGRAGEDNDGDYDAESGTTASNMAVPVWTGELSVKKRLNERVVTGFPIADVLTPRKPGAYSVTIERVRAPGDNPARDTERYNTQAHRRWIFDTDLMLTSFAGQDGLHVFVRSLKTAKPVSGAEVSLLAANNDELGHVKTDGDGQAVFAAGLTRGVNALAPVMLMAYLGDDFSVIELNRPSLDLSDQGVEGREDTNAVDGYLYTDRGIYRPGETIDVAGLIRDRVGKALPPTPIALVLNRPDGVEAGHWRLTPNEAGGIFQAIALSPTAPHGTWRIEASLAGNKEVIGAAEIQVQDFVPQRLKVTVSSDATTLQRDIPAAIKIDARYLFGAPAAGLAGEGHLTFVTDPAPIAEKGWHFGLVGEHLDNEPQDIAIDAMDADGKSSFNLDLRQIKLPVGWSAPLKAKIAIGVVEPGGRTTDTEIAFPVWLTNVMVGLRPINGTGRVGQGERARIETALFQPDGSRVARAAVDYKLIQIVTNYDYYFENGGWRWKRFTRERPVFMARQALAANMAGIIETPALEVGRYRLEVTDPETGIRSSIMIDAGWMVSDDDNPAPEKVSLSFDGAAVKAGGTAYIKIKPPFAGEMLVTVASSRVFQTRTLSVPADGKTVDIEVSADWGPGAYVIANLYRPQAAAEGHAPLRAVGVAWVPVDMADRTLAVAIGAPPVARPRTRLDVPVTVTGAKSGEPVFVTLAAVDEGILQLTRFTAPNPNDYYFGKRRLSVDIRDDYAHLIDASGAEAGEIRQGGDAGGAGLAVVPTKTVALFSGLVKLGADGKAVIPLDLPDFNGGLRLMAVAFGASGMGHADMLMPVRDPVVGEISLPRFLAPKDNARMTLLVNNVEGTAGKYHVHIADGGAVGGPPVDEDLTLAAAEQKIETFPISGGEAGIGTVALTLTGPDRLKIDHSWQIQVRPAQFPLTIGTVAMQQPGESFALDPNLLKGFMPGSAKVTVAFSTLRGIDLPGLVAALDQYPYGCSEQLTSRALPLTYLEDLKSAAGNVAPEDEHLRVQEAIDRLLEREDGDGSFGLWRLGDRQATPYLGAYIVDFLARAKVKGYGVPDEALDRAYKGMDRYDSGGGWMTEVFWSPSPPQYRQDPVLAGKAYAAYVLARAKRADIGELRYLHDTSFARLEPVAKAQLGTALAIMGDKARSVHALDAAEKALSNPKSRWDWAGDYYRTPVRDIAILLTLAAEIGDSERVQRLTAMLEAQDTRTEFLSTQEQAWLSVAAATLLAKGGPVAVSVNQAPAVPTPPPVTLKPDPAAIAAGLKLGNAGQSPVFRAVTVYGIPVEAPSAMANVVAVTKSVTRMDGSAVDLAAVKQNDRLVVHLFGKAGDDAYHQSILVDMLPAGWEIEAIIPPATDDKGNGFPWVGKITPTKTAEKRDDRFVAAIDLGSREARYLLSKEDGGEGIDPKSFNLAYVVRAVTQGQFVLPAAVLQDMYRPPVMARTAAGTVSIAGKQ